ncbi:MAG: release factor glutamine methyltransferase [Flavobacteriales bacterium]|jgi:release factor glutamine methyltransferase
MNPANNSIAAVFDFLRSELTAMYGEREAKSMAYQVLLVAFDISRMDLIVKRDQKLSESEIVTTYRYRERLLRGEPLQYILGSTNFYDLEIGVKPGVLIPRPETEELVSWVLSVCSENDEIWDIGTGSGCIALAIKKVQPSANVMASDKLNAALIIAKENAHALNLDVKFFQHDILKESSPKEGLTIIVSNPPYILARESETMPENVLKHEPNEALFTTNNDPLQFYTRIADVALNSLAPNGYLFFECHELYAQKVKGSLIEKGFVNVELREDMQGKPRMVLGQRN